MVCRTAWLISEPGIRMVEEIRCSSWNYRTKKTEYWYEPTLLPWWEVILCFDYGACCGVDCDTVKFETEEAALELIRKIKSGNHEWLKYYPDLIEKDDDDAS